MRINATVLGTKAARTALRSNTIVCGVLDELGTVRCDVDRPEFAEASKILVAAGVVSLRAEVHLDASELATVSHFVMESSRTFREPDAVWQKNLAELHAAEARRASSVGEVRIPTRLHIGAARIGPREVAAPESSCLEYVVGHDVGEILTSAAPTGFHLEACVSTRQERGTRVSRLWCDSLMAPAIGDASVRWVAPEAPSCLPAHEVHGLRTYRSENLQSATDFARCAEPATWDGTPEWVVSRRVTELAREARVRGWRFVPTLVHGTTVYAEYIETWERHLGPLMAVLGERRDTLRDGTRRAEAPS